MRDPKKPSLLKRADAASLGIEMGAAVGFGYLLGTWLDSELATAPWGQGLGIAFGIGAAANAVVRVALKWRRELRTQARQEVA